MRITKEPEVRKQEILNYSGKMDMKKPRLQI